MSDSTVDINKVVEIVQTRFPLQWEICLQQAYIELLQKQIPEQTPEE